MKAGTRFRRPISTCSFFFLGQEFPLCLQIFGPSHGEQLPGAGAAVRAVWLFQRLLQDIYLRPVSSGDLQNRCLKRQA